MTKLILAINPGSTSTKLAVYEDDNELFSESIRHSDSELEQFDNIYQQLDMRKELIVEALNRHNISTGKLSCVVGRGGLLPPVKPGGYYVNQAMLDCLKSDRVTQHASNLGAMLAYDIARPLGIPAFIYDAVSSSDLPPMAQLTGLPEIPRRSFCHALNSRAQAIKYAKSLKKRYEDLNFIVAHLGGGISVSAHQHGKIVDSTADDDGPFAPERTGGMPLLSIIELCYSGKYTKGDMLRKVRGAGGLRAHLGTTDCNEIERRIANGDEYAKLVFTAQAYQISKGIALVSVALCGKIDYIILTGGLANSALLTEQIKTYAGFFAPIVVMPGESELEALALGAGRILDGVEEAREFKLDD